MAILNTAPQDEAILSNVGEVGEFRIRNSAKAFNILSSGLYANKIRAIIRELSCNAVDSHIAAGKATIPFETHLPTTMEPWFAVRDFGTGLNHEQVTSIYTTYFESTKTNSNDFIGALGLGSKSPFSYTDNFTVTATQDGVQRIYSAFINGTGIPSVVKMGEETTEAPNGVEVKFSVNERYDFRSFEHEARQVYTYFKLRPVITGVTNFEFHDVEYESRDIIPGVHSHNGGHTVAIMGNISYPVQVPDSDKSLGELRSLLKCSLELNFDIGELDFQASREGLSYIPQTVNAIKRKLEALNDKLTEHLAEEANAIENEWERSIFLHGKRKTLLWGPAVVDYVANTKFELFDVSNQWTTSYDVELSVEELAAANLTVTGFSVDRGRDTTHKCSAGHIYTNNLDANGQRIRQSVWNVRVATDTFIVVNDTKIGATERAKYHWRKKSQREWRELVFVFDRLDKTKPIDKDVIVKLLRNPPEKLLFNASDLQQKVRNVGVSRDVTILQFEERGGSRYRSASKEMVWRESNTLDSFDTTKTHYYIAMSGFVPQFEIARGHSAHSLVELLKHSKLAALDVPVYGVRKADLEAVKTRKNWIALETYLVDKLTEMEQKILVSGIKASIAEDQILKYNLSDVVKLLNDGETKSLLTEFIDVPTIAFHSVNQLLNVFRPDHVPAFKDVISKYNDKFNSLTKRYPLINKLESYRTDASDIANYINVIDSVKGV